jgi:heptosyltransferase I
LKNQDPKLKQLPKVAVLRLSAIGDVVLCASMVLNLVKSREFEVSWITTNQTKELLGEIDGVEFIIVPKPKNIRTFLECRDILKNREFDCLLLAQASFSAHFVSMNVRSKRKIGFDPSRSRDLHRFFINECIGEKEEHFVDAYFNFAASIKLKKPDLVDWGGLFMNNDEGSLGNLNLPEGKNIMAVHPCSSKSERNWRIVSYAKVIDHAKAMGIEVILTGGGGSGEIAFNRQIMAMCKNTPINLVGQVTLSELPYLMRKVDVLVAPDTGVVHIARAVGTPVVGLYAVANPVLTGPYKAVGYSINKYHDALDIYCAIDKTSFHQRVHNSKAMELITVDEVTDKIDMIIKKLSLN